MGLVKWGVFFSYFPESREGKPLRTVLLSVICKHLICINKNIEKWKETLTID